MLPELIITIIKEPAHFWCRDQDLFWTIYQIKGVLTTSGGRLNCGENGGDGGKYVIQLHMPK